MKSDLFCTGRAFQSPTTPPLPPPPSHSLHPSSSEKIEPSTSEHSLARPTITIESRPGLGYVPSHTLAPTFPSPLLSGPISQILHPNSCCCCCCCCDTSPVRRPESMNPHRYPAPLAMDFFQRKRLKQDHLSPPRAFLSATTEASRGAPCEDCCGRCCGSCSAPGPRC
jgi:hypothetical protein